MSIEQINSFYEREKAELYLIENIEKKEFIYLSDIPISHRFILMNENLKHLKLNKFDKDKVMIKKSDCGNLLYAEKDGYCLIQLSGTLQIEIIKLIKMSLYQTEQLKNRASFYSSPED